MTGSGHPEASEAPGRQNPDLLKFAVLVRLALRQRHAQPVLFIERQVLHVDSPPARSAGKRRRIRSAAVAVAIVGRFVWIAAQASPQVLCEYGRSSRGRPGRGGCLPSGRQSSRALLGPRPIARGGSARSRPGTARFVAGEAARLLRAPKFPNKTAYPWSERSKMGASFASTSSSISEETSRRAGLDGRRCQLNAGDRTALLPLCAYQPRNGEAGLAGEPSARSDGNNHGNLGQSIEFCRRDDEHRPPF